MSRSPRIFERTVEGQVRFVELDDDDGWLVTTSGVRGGDARTERKYLSSSARASTLEARIRDLERDGFTEVSAASAAPDPTEALIAAIEAAHDRELPRLAEQVRRAGDAVVQRVATLRTTAAIRILVELRAPELLPPLTDPDPVIRLAVVQALAALGRAVELQPSLSDDEPAVRAAAREALGIQRTPPLADKDDALLRRAGSPLQLPAQADELRALLEAGANPNVVGYGGVSPLLAVCGHGTAASLEVLLAAGARLTARDDDGGTALHRATSYLGPRAEIAGALRAERVPILRRLLVLGLDPNGPDRHGRLPLWFAVTYLDRAACEVLLEAGARAERALEVAVEHGNLGVVQLLLERGGQATAALVERAEEEHHAAVAAELRRRLGMPATDGDPREVLVSLARRLGAEAASSAESSGDLAHYQDDEDLDPDDLVSEYWTGHYEELARQAIEALPVSERARLGDVEALLEGLYETYAEAFSAAM